MKSARWYMHICMCVWCVCVCVLVTVVSDSLWPHGLKPTMFLCLWDSPGRNIGVDCHSLLHDGMQYNPNLIQFSSVTQSCPTLCDPVNRSTPVLPVHHQLPEFTQIHVHQVSDAIQPSHPLSSPSPPAPNPSQHLSLFQWVNTSHEVAKVLEFQL